MCVCCSVQNMLVALVAGQSKSMGIWFHNVSAYIMVKRSHVSAATLSCLECFLGVCCTYLSAESGKETSAQVSWSLNISDILIDRCRVSMVEKPFQRNQRHDPESPGHEPVRATLGITARAKPRYRICSSICQLFLRSWYLGWSHIDGHEWSYQ